MEAANQEVVMLPAPFNAINQADPNEEPPTERKRRGRRAALDLRVGSVEPHGADDGTVADAVLVDGKGKAVGVVTLVDDGNGRVLRAEGKIDQAGIDRAAREIFRSIGATGEQQYEVRKVETRTVQVAPLPTAADVLAALRGSNGAAQVTEVVQNESPCEGETAKAQEPLSETQDDSHPELIQS